MKLENRQGVLVKVLLGSKSASLRPPKKNLYRERYIED
jgi:hypothetical protein